MENAKINDLLKKVSEERNEIAFSEIFDFIAPKINAYFIKNNLSIEQAEELTQEVLSTIWLKEELFDPEKSKFITWSFTIARNKKIDFYRKNQKNIPNEEDIRDFLYNENQADDYEIESTIKNITKELDQNQKELIKTGQSKGEITKLTKITKFTKLRNLRKREKVGKS